MKFQVIPDQQTPKVPEIGDLKAFLSDNKEALAAFLEFAKTQHNAVGLAANQCSCDDERFMLRVFAKRTSSLLNTWKLIINPEIVEFIGIKEYKVEGCLTWKGKAVVAMRSRAVKVRYFDENGSEYNETYKGFESQVWQHEINHLNGVEEVVTSDYKFLDSIKDVEVGRNEPCPCGSGKKYKNCCLNLK